MYSLTDCKYIVFFSLCLEVKVQRFEIAQLFVPQIVDLDEKEALDEYSIVKLFQ